jgi:ubiquinone/menaquinone biosynthesis C-methylase UbiE
MGVMSTLLTMLDALDDLPQATELRERSYRGLGDTVVDVGCGGGLAVGELTRRGVRAIGVDLDPEMVEAARERWPGAEFHVADVAALPLDDGSVTGYRADKVLHTLASPDRAVAEARRVLETGGRAVLLGQDWDTIVIDSDQPELTRRIVHARADTITHPRIARAYRNLLLDAGFHDADVEVHTAVFTDAAMLPIPVGHATAARQTGAVGGDEAENWISEQTRRAQDGRLLVAIPMFLAAATR